MEDPSAVETTFECRGCGKNVMGLSDGTIFDTECWGRIMRIDGPNTVCPACIHDKLDDVLQSFREDGYEHAFVVVQSPRS